MANQISHEKENDSKNFTILVAVDFSYCSRIALRKARDLMANQTGRIVVLYVIDRKYAKRFFRHCIGAKANMKRQIFMLAKEKLKDFLQEEALNGAEVKAVVCHGIPYIEINKRAVEYQADRIILGSWAPYFAGAGGARS